MANVLLGVCGGIAAYKSCEIARLLKKSGHDVRVILTASAEKFVTRLTFEALTGNRAHVDLFDDGEFGTAHIELARWADRFVVAPATADAIARLAQGRSSDLLSTVFLAYRGRTFVAPSMNTAMWEHPFTQENLGKLRAFGASVIEPERGELACGEHGEGKLAAPQAIVDRVVRGPTGSPLEGKRVVVTLGPTREYLDAVRFISSPSTGKMGLEIARAAAHRGAFVTVIHGPLAQPVAGKFEAVIPVTSAAEMHRAALAAADWDVFVAAASVSDFAPAEVAPGKVKKADAGLAVDLVANPDILAAVGRKKTAGRVLVGFAAETDDLVANARAKLAAKSLDLVVANEVFRETRGFAKDSTSVVFVTKTDAEPLENASKRDVATRLCERIEDLLRKNA